MVFETNVSIFRVISFNAFWKFLLLGNSAWDFLGGVKFWSREFWGFDFCPHFNHPCHLKSRVFPPPLGTKQMTETK